jgi:hypothetical protein
MARQMVVIAKPGSTPDGDGNLLDHSLSLWGSPMGDSEERSSW